MHLSAHCQHEMHDIGIHVYTFEIATRQSVDEFLNSLDELLANSPHSLFLVLDFCQDGMPPPFYFIDQVRSFFASPVKYPPLYMAFLFAQPSMMRATELLITRMGIKGEQRFFAGGKALKQALSWLEPLANEDVTPHSRPSWYRNLG